MKFKNSLLALSIVIGCNTPISYTGDFKSGLAMLKEYLKQKNIVIYLDYLKSIGLYVGNELFDTAKETLRVLRKETPNMIVGIIGSAAGVALAQWLMNKYLMQVLFKIEYTVLSPSAIKESFKSVIGNEQAKEALQDVVDYIKNAEKYHELGIKAPKGVLMYGPPGTGKTLLAKACAGECGCSFIPVDASYINSSPFVGQAATRVRRLFEMARKHAPCIIFIDEFDSIARQRSGSAFGSGAEAERALTQLLCEMDGFKSTEKPVIVIGATNELSLIDEAAIRAGRFDHKIYVGLPNAQERKEILHLYAGKMPLDFTQVNFDFIAELTAGYSGAQLGSVMKKVGVRAVKQNLTVIEQKLVEEVFLQEIFGKRISHKKTIAPEVIKNIAYHEAGHAVMHLLFENVIKEHLYKVSIYRSNNILGYNMYVPDETQLGNTRDTFIARIIGLFGGKAAEELMCGLSTDGAVSDIEKATSIAKQMVCVCGVSGLGPISYSDIIWKNQPCSEEVRRAIDGEIYAILNDCWKQTVALIGNNKDCLEAIAQALLEKETLTGQEVKDIFLSFNPAPVGLPA